jgi:N-acetylglutamate synthase-like GNAT family acetyltransferase
MEKMVFEVRHAVEGDVPEIQEITKEAFKMYMEGAGINGTLPALEETYEDVKKDIESKLVFVAILDNKVVGSVRIELYDNKTAYLSRLGVAKVHQSHGVGRILMNAVDEAMMEYGITNLYLHTASRLFSLVRFYYGRGFYIDSTASDRGYIRALLCKEYETVSVENSLNVVQSNLAVV